MRAGEHWEDLERFVKCMSLAIKPPGLGSSNPPDQRALCDHLSEMGDQGELLRFSLVSMLATQGGSGKERWVQIVELTRGVRGRSSTIALGVLLYKATALRELGFARAAVDILEEVMDQREPLPHKLACAALYEQALVLEALGEGLQARGVFERLFSMEPGFADVAGRLGVGKAREARGVAAVSSS